MANHESEPSWFDAIVTVLQRSGGAMHYADISDEILGTGLKTTVGATPAATVAAIISTDITKKGSDSAFVRVKRGEYVLRSSEAGMSGHGGAIGDGETAHAESAEELDETSGIRALGMFWRRDMVNWTTSPQLFGQQQKNATLVDFGEQRGVYLLHDGRETVYVGRVTDQDLGKRLAQHTSDRLNGRWDRFSWFGIYAVTQDGKVVPRQDLSLSPDQIILELEAVLIESLEPPLNRRRGDGLRAVEYIQGIDPLLQKKNLISILGGLQQKLMGDA